MSGGIDRRGPGARTGSSSPVGDVATPGKRTLTEGLVQFKTNDDGGVGAGGGAGSSGQQQPGGVPLQTPPLQTPPLQTPPLQAPPQQPPPLQQPATKDMVSLVKEVDGQFVQIYVSPGGIDHKPDVFMFFHGHDANLMIDPKLSRSPNFRKENVSGNDSAAAAVQQAKATNTVVLLPQGVDGGPNKDPDEEGGAMKALRGKGSLPKFIDDILDVLVEEVPVKGDPGKIVPNRIALAGHSAGGYEGIHDALRTAGKYADTITDITLMDTSYADSHFQDALDWIFNTPSPNKTIRIVQSDDQILRSKHKVPDPSDPTKKKKIEEITEPHWVDYFSDDKLEAAAKLHKMTVNHIVKYASRPIKGKGSNLDDIAADRGNHTGTLQHTQVINSAQKVQCDILVLRSDLGHHEIRDNVMDDAIDSIGQGAAGSDNFGKNQIPYYGRDPAAPHANNHEHVPGEPGLEPKPEPKHRKP